MNSPRLIVVRMFGDRMELRGTDSEIDSMTVRMVCWRTMRRASMLFP